MTAYSGNVQTMSQQDLEDELDKIAESWRKTPPIAHDLNEGKRYHEVKDALKERFNVSMVIKGISGFDDFWAVQV